MPGFIQMMCSTVREAKCECWQLTSEQTAMNSTLSIFFCPWFFFRRPLLPPYPDFLTAADAQLVLNIFLRWPSTVLSFPSVLSTSPGCTAVQAEEFRTRMNLQTNSVSGKELQLKSGLLLLDCDPCQFQVRQ